MAEQFEYEVGETVYIIRPFTDKVIGTGVIAARDAYCDRPPSHCYKIGNSWYWPSQLKKK